MPTFATALNNLTSKTGLGTAYTAGSGTLTPWTGFGAALAAELAASGQPALSAAHPLRITLYSVVSPTVYTVFEATAVSGDALAVTVVEGTDQNYLQGAGTSVACSLTAGMVRTVHSELRTLSPGPLQVNVLDYGAVADGGVTDNAAAFQAAVDDLAANMPADGTGTVYVPTAAGTYSISKSIWVDRDGIAVRGGGRGTIVKVTNAKVPAFIFGVRRNDSGKTIGSSRRPDLFGKLDTSVANATGQRWGLNTRADSYAQFHATPFSAGANDPNGFPHLDNFAHTNKLAIEFCFEPGAGMGASTPVFGCGDIAPLTPSPFFIYTYNSKQQLRVFFRTSNQADFPLGAFRAFSFTIGAGPVIRVAVQIDLDNAVCTAFVNGTQVAFLDSTNLDGGSGFVPGLTFAANDVYPFLIGWLGQYGPFGGGPSADFALYGLRISNAIRYQDNGTGTVQKRVDAPTTAINDLYSYFTSDANALAYLKCQDNPATAGRVVTVKVGGAASDGETLGLFIQCGTTPTARNGLSDMIVQGNHVCGQMVCVGQAQDLTLERLKVIDGYNAIGQFAMGANYTLVMTDCLLGGEDAGFFGASQGTYANNTTFQSNGRVAVRYFGGGGEWHKTTVLFASNVTEGFLKARSFGFGGAFIFENLLVDYEGAQITGAMFHVENHAYQPSTYLRLKDVLAPHNGAINPGSLYVSNLQVFALDFEALVEVDGPSWHGEVRGLGHDGPRIKHEQLWGDRTGIRLYETEFVGPPRRFSWYCGAHVLDVSSPADGQYSQWQCVATGAYGTATPPKWSGRNPFQANQNAIASYVTNHIYMTADLT